ncbi:NAD(P)H-dependent oxidoreductase subunit E [Sneathiella sp. HT1-7]|uniref:NAD(P)H-dependent oxidoreductase subunit E n=1 Tax=Sneathiella sp. HT1-7 TaxID=2887192 RepID=UPI001D132D93|nr:NAD(P)H-dependent oxidoreductase subunit E [Sneathiella sp. HT1-7]MCC3306541.1 NAD(P)H-dependent oxidoreductase subunit E [Sneathiella sp. HT1-7]
MAEGKTLSAVPKAPGKGGRKARYQNKGRQVEPIAAREIAALLGSRSRQSDLLLEHLHLIQDTYGSLSVDHLAALAEEMRLALAEVYEVATFYHNFTVVKEGESKPAALTLKVCDSLSCEMAGAMTIKQKLIKKYGGTIRVTHGACMGRCEIAPVVRLKDRYVGNATIGDVDALIEAAKKNNPLSLPDFTSFDDYKDAGGFSTHAKLRAGDLVVDTIIEALNESGHRGLGGAGFPHALKLNSVLSVPGPRYMAVNADESEPGTFKDRYYLNNNPYQFLEGMLIAAEIVEAERIYIFLRDEYPETYQILSGCIEKLKAEKLDSGRKIYLRRGAGAYICGEESAMLESIEGKRALPRHKPPFPAHVGLFGRPTLINNVETLYWLPDIIHKGPEWFKAGGRHGGKGFRSFSLSGHVKKPGVYITPAGITAEELIEEFGGGMQDGHDFRAYLPGGASGGLLPASMADIPLDFGTLEKHGCFIGSAAVIVISDKDDLKMVARNLMRFFEDESCGQCTPCRAGTEKALRLMEAEHWDSDLLTELSAVMRDASICGLGQAAPNGLMSIFKHFPEAVK